MAQGSDRNHVALVLRHLRRLIVAGSDHEDRIGALRAIEELIAEQERAGRGAPTTVERSCIQARIAPEGVTDVEWDVAELAALAEEGRSHLGLLRGSQADTLLDAPGREDARNAFALCLKVQAEAERMLYTLATGTSGTFVLLGATLIDRLLAEEPRALANAEVACAVGRLKATGAALADFCRRLMDTGASCHITHEEIPHDFLRALTGKLYVAVLRALSEAGNARAGPALADALHDAEELAHGAPERARFPVDLDQALASLRVTGAPPTQLIASSIGVLERAVSELPESIGQLLGTVKGGLRVRLGASVLSDLTQAGRLIAASIRNATQGRA